MKITNKKLYNSLASSVENDVGDMMDSDTIQSIARSNYAKATQSNVSKAFSGNDKSDKLHSKMNNSLFKVGELQQKLNQASQHYNEASEHLASPSNSAQNSSVGSSSSRYSKPYAKSHNPSKDSYSATRERNDSARASSQQMRNQAYKDKNYSHNADMGNAYMMMNHSYDDTDRQAIDMYDDLGDKGKQYFRSLSYLGMTNPRMLNQYLNDGDLTNGEQNVINSVDQDAGYAVNADGNLVASDNQPLSKDDMRMIKAFLRDNPKHAQKGDIYRSSHYSDAKDAWKSHSLSERLGFKLGWHLEGAILKGKATHAENQNKHLVDTTMQNLSSNEVRQSLPDILRNAGDSKHISHDEVVTHADRGDVKQISGMLKAINTRAKRHGRALTGDAPKIAHTADDWLNQHNLQAGVNASPLAYHAGLTKKQVYEREDYLAQHTSTPVERKQDRFDAKKLDSRYSDWAQDWYDDKMKAFSRNTQPSTGEKKRTLKMMKQHPRLDETNSRENDKMISKDNEKKQATEHQRTMKAQRGDDMEME